MRSRAFGLSLAFLCLSLTGFRAFEQQELWRLLPHRILEVLENQSFATDDREDFVDWLENEGREFLRDSQNHDWLQNWRQSWDPAYEEEFPRFEGFEFQNLDHLDSMDRVEQAALISGVHFAQYRRYFSEKPVELVDYHEALLEEAAESPQDLKALLALDSLFFQRYANVAESFWFQLQGFPNFAFERISKLNGEFEPQKLRWLERGVRSGSGPWDYDALELDRLSFLLRLNRNFLQAPETESDFSFTKSEVSFLQQELADRPLGELTDEQITGVYESSSKHILDTYDQKSRDRFWSQALNVFGNPATSDGALARAGLLAGLYFAARRLPQIKGEHFNWGHARSSHSLLRQVSSGEGRLPRPGKNVLTQTWFEWRAVSRVSTYRDSAGETQQRFQSLPQQEALRAYRRQLLVERRIQGKVLRSWGRETYRQIRADLNRLFGRGDQYHQQLRSQMPSPTTQEGNRLTTARFHLQTQIGTMNPNTTRKGFEGSMQEECKGLLRRLPRSQKSKWMPGLHWAKNLWDRRGFGGLRGRLARLSSTPLQRGRLPRAWQRLPQKMNSSHMTMFPGESIRAGMVTRALAGWGGAALVGGAVAHQLIQSRPYLPLVGDDKIEPTEEWMEEDDLITEDKRLQRIWQEAVNLEEQRQIQTQELEVQLREFERELKAKGHEWEFLIDPRSSTQPLISEGSKIHHFYVIVRKLETELEREDPWRRQRSLENALLLRFQQEELRTTEQSGPPDRQYWKLEDVVDLSQANPRHVRAILRSEDLNFDMESLWIDSDPDRQTRFDLWRRKP